MAQQENIIKLKGRIGDLTFESRCLGNETQWQLESVFGGSYFNHVFLISAAIPVWTDVPESLIAKVDADGKMIKDGVVTSDGYAVNHVLFSRNTPYLLKSDTSRLLPSQAMPTIGDRLNEKDISWAWYSEGWDDAVTGLFIASFAPVHCHFAPLFNGVTPPKYVESETEVLGVPVSLMDFTLDRNLGYGVIGVDSYKYAFKVPSVRNINKTAPYMHNGVYQTLGQVSEMWIYFSLLTFRVFSRIFN